MKPYNKLNCDNLCDDCNDVRERFMLKVKIEKTIKEQKEKGFLLTSTFTKEKISGQPSLATTPCFLCGKFPPHYEYPLPPPFEKNHICMDCADEIGYSEVFRNV